MPPNSRLRMHAAAYAAACTPPHSRRSHAAALVPPLSRRRSDAAASHAAAFFGCSIACTPPHPCTPPHMPPHAGHRIHAALAGALCRWKRTTRSAFFNAEHDAGGRELARAGRGGAGRGGRGAVFEKGCFGVGWGGVLCTYISPKGVCDGGVKNRGWGWKSGQKETPSGQKETPSGQFVRKVGKSALELGKKISIMVNPKPQTLGKKLVFRKPFTLSPKPKP